MVYFIIVAVSFSIAAAMYACCVSAGEADKQAEKTYKEYMRKMILSGRKGNVLSFGHAELEVVLDQPVGNWVFRSSCGRSGLKREI